MTSCINIHPEVVLPMQHKIPQGQKREETAKDSTVSESNIENHQIILVELAVSACMYDSDVVV